MIDLTLDEKDKDNFILKVYFKEDSPNYFVQYASGREEQFVFSVHNINMVLYRMEGQYRQYRDDYVSRVLKVRFQAVLRKLIEALTALLGVVFTSALPIPSVCKFITAMIILVLSLYYQKRQTFIEKASNSSLNTIEIIDEYLKNKDQFKLTVVDPVTKKEEDWYLVTLSNIQEFFEANLLTKFGAVLTDEIKAEEGDRISKELKKIYDCKENASC